MREPLTLQGGNGLSEIYIESGLFDRAGVVIGQAFSPSRIHIVTDSNVAPLYLARLESQLAFPVSHTIIPAGEEHKHLATVEDIYHDMLAAGITRKDLVVALGGGVVGDITGFAAATLLRGVSLCQIPTTLLAQVDSSVGGKTGVDLPEGKNLVGAFYQPRLVLIDPKVLSSLPDSTFADGMAEVIKYGYIANKTILSLVAQPNYRDNIEQIIYECVKIKRDVVAIDEHDTGLRMILNFGHTIGHAAEKLGNYTALTHGQAVAIGMAAAMRLSALLGNADLTASLLPLLDHVGLPSTLAYDREAIFDALLADKKKFGGTVNFILVREAGRAEITPIETDRLHAYILKL
ncbi:MAG: 3-dehydroquinate synthase [Agathobaculum sp.]|uniref:3-dehydroquinate synthase n=1 Tax=Agathobaculum sp. TaxID=2048138 RepID=UPI002A809F54|nr:3-dehydroquinate synthase [Agathobaculum sp.]MDY3711990.1 3-dehydroquinate synthase [Agathobaculum sp.]